MLYFLISSSNFESSNMIILFGMNFSLPNLAFLFYIFPSLYNILYIYFSLFIYLLLLCYFFLLFLPIFHQNFNLSFFSALRELANLVEIAIGVYVFFLRCLAHATFDLSFNLLYSTHDYCNIYAILYI